MNNIKEKIEQMEKELEELKEKLNQENVTKRERYEEYWFLDCGDFESDYDEYSEIDDYRYSVGNYFKTKEQVENYKEKLLIEQELRDIARELNKGEEIDWNDNDQKKYYLYYCYIEEGISRTFDFLGKGQGIIYCLDENFMTIAIKRIGEERLTKYLKGELE